VGALYAAVILILRWNHIGDVAHEIALADRWLRGESLYGTVVPGLGSLWPPFASVALIPFALLARLSINVATAAWSVVGVACLVASVWLGMRWGTRPALLALAAVAMPVQTNFEHHNVNTVLLVLIMAGAVDLRDRRDRRAGIWFGLAAALKAFPVVVLVCLALRRRWEALAAGVAAGAAATLVPLLRYGPGGAVAEIQQWLHVGFSPGQWQLATNDQSIRALATRLGASPGLALALIAIPLVLMVVIALRKRRAAGELDGIGAATVAAVLAAPLAWVHYYTLAYPAWLAVLSRRSTAAGGPTKIAAGGDPAIESGPRLPSIVAGWIAAIATSGLLTAGQGPIRRALLGASAYTWGGLLLLGLLATMQPPPQETA
jgi:hypothetical protein